MVVPREDNLTIDKFKGLNVASHPSLINDHQFSALQNFHFGNTAELQRRRGLFMETNFATLAGWIPGLDVEVLGTFSTGAVLDPQHFENVVHYVYTINGRPYAGFQATKAHVDEDDVYAIGGFPTDTVCVGCVQYNDVLYFITANHGIYKAPIPVNYGSQLVGTAITGSPNGAAFCSFKDRLWVVQCTSSTSTTTTLSSSIRYSAAGNFESWDPANLVNVQPGNSDVITNLVPYSDRIMVFKKLSIWNMYLQGSTPPISAVRLLTMARGAITRQSVVVVNEVIYFIAHDGVWRTDGNAFSELSADIQPLFTYGPALITYNQSDWISYYDNHLYIRTSSDNVVGTLTMPKSGGAPESPGGYFYLIFNIQNGSWGQELYSDDASYRNVLTRPRVCRDETGKIIFLQGAKDRVYSRHQDYWTDDYSGTRNQGASSIVTRPIVNVLTTKRIEVDRYSRVKRLKYLVLGMRGTACTPSFLWTVDGDPRPVIDFDPSAVSKFAAFKVPGCGYFRTFELTMTESQASDFEVTFLNFIIHLKRQLAESPR